jgi:hypothetical protein
MTVMALPPRVSAVPATVTMALPLGAVTIAFWLG